MDLDERVLLLHTALKSSAKIVMKENSVILSVIIFGLILATLGDQGILHEMSVEGINFLRIKLRPVSDNWYDLTFVY